MSPPTASISSAISRAVRSGVPLNNRCSRKCEIPDCSGVSSREPVPTQTPTHSEATSGIDSVTSLMPLVERRGRDHAETAPRTAVLPAAQLSAPRSSGAAGPRPSRRQDPGGLRPRGCAAGRRRVPRPRGRPDRGCRRSTRARSRRRPRTRRAAAAPASSPSPGLAWATELSPPNARLERRCPPSESALGLGRAARAGSLRRRPRRRSESETLPCGSISSTRTSTSWPRVTTSSTRSTLLALAEPARCGPGRRAREGC